MKLLKKILGMLCAMLVIVGCTDIGALTVQAADMYDYNVHYFVQVAQYNDAVLRTVDGKYYVSATSTNSGYAMVLQAEEGTVITVEEETSDVPGIYENGNPVAGTFKGYSGLHKYSYSSTFQNGKHTGTVTKDSILMIELFYDLKDPAIAPSTYIEEHYAELEDQSVSTYDLVVDGVKYNSYKQVKKTGTSGTEATSAPLDSFSYADALYLKYESIASPAAYPSKAVIAVDGSTVLYQFYRLHPQYNITYYKESETGNYPVGNKKYEKVEVVSDRMQSGTTVSYLDLANGGAAAAIGGAAITGTEKNYDGYKFSEAATLQNGQSSTTLAIGQNNNIDLFFDKIVPTTTYKEKYYVELDDQSVAACDLELGGVKYELKEENTATVNNNEAVSITDKAGVAPYSSYTLKASTAQYPSAVNDVADDGSTILYQIFDIKRANYTEVYWLEKSDAVKDYIDVEVDGATKRFVIGKTYAVTDVKTNTKVTVRNRDEEFVGYQAVASEISAYPSTANALNADGSTLVHKFYILVQGGQAAPLPTPEPTPTPPAPSVEPSPIPSVEEEVEDEISESEPVEEVIEVKSPKTGDTSDSGKWACILLLIFTGYTAVFCWKRWKS